jgi:hypothetical protein
LRRACRPPNRPRLSLTMSSRCCGRRSHRLRPTIRFVSTRHVTTWTRPEPCLCSPRPHRRSPRPL